MTVVSTREFNSNQAKYLEYSWNIENNHYFSIKLKIKNLR